MHIVIMGIAGAGKSTLGSVLATSLSLALLEGDDFHPLGNVAKMSAGEPLDDDDRLPWLHRIVEAALAANARNARGTVICCSALRRRYRDMLRHSLIECRFIYLRISSQLAFDRVAERSSHFMPTSLIGTQLETLEEPAPDERALWLEAAIPRAEQVNAIEAWLAEPSIFSS